MALNWDEMLRGLFYLLHSVLLEKNLTKIVFQFLGILQYVEKYISIKS
jgi:hypothetical protein